MFVFIVLLPTVGITIVVEDVDVDVDAEDGTPFPLVLVLVLVFPLLAPVLVVVDDVLVGGLMTCVGLPDVVIFIVVLFGLLLFTTIVIVVEPTLPDALLLDTLPDTLPDPLLFPFPLVLGFVLVLFTPPFTVFPLLVGACAFCWILGTDATSSVLFLLFVLFNSINLFRLTQLFSSEFSILPYGHFTHILLSLFYTYYWQAYEFGLITKLDLPAFTSYITTVIFTVGFVYFAYFVVFDIISGRLSFPDNAIFNCFYFDTVRFAVPSAIGYNFMYPSGTFTTSILGAELLPAVAEEGEDGAD